MNKVWHMTEIATADIYLLGHAHQIGVFERARVRLQQTRAKQPDKQIRIKEDKIYLGLTGSFLKGYEDNKDSYVVDKGYPPSSLGALKFTVNMKRRKKNGIRTLRKFVTWGVL